jgi:hypothetical protein
MPLEQSIIWAGLFSAATFFGSIAIACFVISRLPVDYLNRSHAGPRSDRSLPTRLVLVVLRNLLGLLFASAGVVMLFTPGQGTLFIVLGVSLLDIPGKRGLMRRILANPRVFEALNKIRAAANRPPLDPLT